ncbi:MAG: hypothetical protein AB7F22_09550 [Reyranella sp.]|uniref:hypothetical protein n=1 Tax=Reyranella sp. TaxID=1929291 RepID=UPI003D14E01F
MSARLLLRLLCLSVLAFLPRLSLANEPWDPPSGCRLEKWSDVEAWREWNSHTPATNGDAWAQERRRIADNREVWRWYDRLYIAIMGDKVLTLADCPFGDDMHRYDYERYDAAGGFHVVHVWRYEDHFYALVMRDSGKIYTVSGLPVWSPERARFAYAVCIPPDGTTDEAVAEVAVMSVVDKQPQIETRASMPCFLDDCKLVWEDDGTVTSTCEERDGIDRKRSVLRLSRQRDGWIATPPRP